MELGGGEGGDGGEGEGLGEAEGVGGDEPAEDRCC